MQDEGEWNVVSFDPMDTAEQHKLEDDAELRSWNYNRRQWSMEVGRRRQKL